VVAQVADFSHNHITGTLPESWGRLTFLSVLSLHSNNLTGSLPPAWAQQEALLQL
jgi:hypothetical protein